MIEKNINYYKTLLDKGFLSENILSQLRNLVEDVAILINNKSNNKNLDTNYENIAPSMGFLKGKTKYKITSSLCSEASKKTLLINSTIFFKKSKGFFL